MSPLVPAVRWSALRATAVAVAACAAAGCTTAGVQVVESTLPLRPDVTLVVEAFDRSGIETPGQHVVTYGPYLIKREVWGWFAEDVAALETSLVESLRRAGGVASVLRAGEAPVSSAADVRRVELRLTRLIAEDRHLKGVFASVEGDVVVTQASTGAAFSQALRVAESTTFGTEGGVKSDAIRECVRQAVEGVAASLRER